MSCHGTFSVSRLKTLCLGDRRGIETMDNATEMATFDSGQMS
jgi:hypothetical protein